jgi:hypothetical protein
VRPVRRAYNHAAICTMWDLNISQLYTLPWPVTGIASFYVGMNYKLDPEARVRFPALPEKKEWVWNGVHSAS